jgi:hypothetical protein
VGTEGSSTDFQQPASSPIGVRRTRVARSVIARSYMADALGLTRISLKLTPGG